MNCHEELPLEIAWLGITKVALCDDCWKQVRKMEVEKPQASEQLRRFWQNRISQNKLDEYK